MELKMQKKKVYVYIILLSFFLKKYVIRVLY